VISVTANVAPKLMAELCRAALAGDVATARDRNNSSLACIGHLFVEPIRSRQVGTLQMGLIENELRLPMVPLSAASRSRSPRARRGGCI
jgi:4-hydroxy-tetrahydrodipicolinate synthase